MTGRMRLTPQDAHYVEKVINLPWPTELRCVCGETMKSEGKGKHEELIERMRKHILLGNIKENNG